jgi:hypothetical protein
MVRYYPLNPVGSGASTTLNGNWATGTLTPYVMSPTKADQVASGVHYSFGFSGGTGIGNVKDHFAYELTQATDISGTLDLCLVAFAAFNPEQDAHFRVHAWVSIGTSSAARGVLLDNYSEPAGVGNRWTTTQQALQLLAPQTLTQVRGLAGDFIHVEIGWVFHVAPGNAACYTSYGTRAGDGSIIATDFVAGDAAGITFNGSAYTSAGSAWIEIGSGPTAIPVDDSDPDCCTTGPGQSSGVDTDATSWTATCAGGGAVPTAATPATAESWAA